MLKRRFTGLGIVLCIVSSPLAPARSAPQPRSPQPPFVEGQVLVGYESGAGLQRAAARAAVGATGHRSVVGRQVELLSIPSGLSVAASARALSARPGVAFAEPNYLYRSSLLPDDLWFPDQWGLAADLDVDIDAPEAWDVTTGSGEVTVGIVDSGITLDHPDLVDNIWVNGGEVPDNGIDDDNNGYVDDVNGWDWIDDDNDADDLHGHGTHVAGIAGADGSNGTGVAGVAWDVALQPLRVLDENGVGTTSDIARAFYYAAGSGADIVNVSLGGEGYSRSISAAIAAAPETLFVVAAGNQGVDTADTTQYPCEDPAPNVMCVAAHGTTGALASYSNHGENVDLAAPGSGILSTLPGGYGYASGTSMATPFVAGAAALIRSAHPGATTAQVLGALRDGVDRSALLSSVETSGRLNAAGALALLADSSESGTTIVTHERTIQLKAGKRRVKGVVLAVDGHAACVSGVPVKIKRNGTTIARVVADGSGRFAHASRRTGRYRAVVPRVTTESDDCLRAVSEVVRRS